MYEAMSYSAPEKITAEQIDAMAVQESVNQSVSAIRDKHGELVQTVVITGMPVELEQQLSEVDPETASAVREEIESAQAEQARQIEERLSGIQDKRESLVQDAEVVHVTYAGAGVAGFYDGENAYIDAGILQNASDEMVERVSKHELGHASVGLPEDLDGQVVTDEELKAAMQRELEAHDYIVSAGNDVEITAEDPDEIAEIARTQVYDTLNGTSSGTANIEDAIQTVEISTSDVTNRDMEERYAMQQEDAAPEGPYVRTHWAATSELKEEIEAQGEDFESAHDQVVTHKDNSALVTAMARSKLKAAGFQMIA